METFTLYQKKGISIFNIIFEYLSSIQTTEFWKSTMLMLKISSTSENWKSGLNERKCKIHPKIRNFFSLPSFSCKWLPGHLSPSLHKNVNHDTQFILSLFTQPRKQLTGYDRVHHLPKDSPRKIMMKGIICNPPTLLLY